MIKKILLISVLFSQICLGQKEVIPDSILNKEFNAATSKIDSLAFSDLVSAEMLANKMMFRAKELNYKKGLGQAYATLANIYSSQGNDGKSISYMIKASAIFEEIGDEVLASYVSNNIGITFMELNQYDEARKYLEKSLEFDLRTKNYKHLTSVYNALAEVALETDKNFEEVVFFIKKAEQHQENVSNGYSAASTLNAEAKLRIVRDKNIPLAILKIEEAIRIVNDRETPNPYYLGYSYHLLGKAFFKTQEYKKALRYNDSALFHYKMYNYKKGLRLVYENRKEILAELGNYKQAFEASRLFESYQDSIFNKNQSNQIARMETEFETEQIRAQKEAAEAKTKLAESISAQNRNYFIGSAVIALLILTASLLYFKRTKERKKNELIAVELRETQKRLAIEKQYRDSELKALKAQMNPHFIFNALNSIQEYIILNQKNLAGDYLGKFADLMRTYLHHSDAGFITVEEEVESLHMYLELEALRFEDTLRYSIDIEKAFKNMTIKIPTMLIQPYIENALKHGLLHRLEDRKLQVSFAQKDDSTIVCIIKDNGVGRKKAEEIKAQSNALHKSFATKATENRLQLLNFGKDKKIGVTIEDLLHDDLTAAGTKVTLNIPTLKN
jgi:hypothetical protein